MICSARSGGNEEKQNNYQKSIKNLLTFTPQCANIYSQGRKPDIEFGGSRDAEDQNEVQGLQTALR